MLGQLLSKGSRKGEKMLNVCVFTKMGATSCIGARSKESKVGEIGYRVLQLIV